MARNDAILAVQQDRIREPEFLDACGDLADLLLGMSPGMPGERNQGSERPIFDPKAGPGNPFRTRLEAFWSLLEGVWRPPEGLILHP
jgi:hypothetical protein